MKHGTETSSTKDQLNQMSLNERKADIDQVFRDLSAFQTWLAEQINMARQRGDQWLEVPKEKSSAFEYAMTQMYPDKNVKNPKYYIQNNVRVCLEGTKEEIETAEKRTVYDQNYPRGY